MAERNYEKSVGQRIEKAFPANASCYCVVVSAAFMEE